ncbi:universal stress protein [Parasegetibacter sp. MAH-26]|uniref:Universal stress protein n=2 Tax=Pinibacter aurantiacus TaxID=2851599 RepID=A0A9E2SCW7_9BACT|nr:universal stress protein [Pinibacter aurantiacus]
MVMAFNKILVPVDFTSNTDAAVSHALALSDNSHTEIHLLHVLTKETKKVSYPISRFYTMTAVTFGSLEKLTIKNLEDLKGKIQNALPTIKIIVHLVLEGNVQGNIIQKAQELQTDLIIIGKKRDHSWLSFLNTTSSSFIAAVTNCAVLQVSGEVEARKIGAVVLPVRRKMCERKINLLQTLTYRQRPTIHLITVVNDEDNGPCSDDFINTFRTLSECLHYPMNVKVIQRNNSSKDIFKYAVDINAGLIMIDPFDQVTGKYNFIKSACNMLFVASTK